MSKNTTLSTLSISQKLADAASKLQLELKSYGLSVNNVSSAGILAKEKEDISLALQDYFVGYSLIGVRFSPFMKISGKASNKYSYLHNRLTIQPPFSGDYSNIISLTSHLAFEAKKNEDGNIETSYNQLKISGNIFPYENVSSYFAGFSHINEIKKNNRSAILIKHIGDTDLESFIKEFYDFSKAHFDTYLSNRKIKGSGFEIVDTSGYLKDTYILLDTIKSQLMEGVSSQVIPDFYNKGNLSDYHTKWKDMCNFLLKRKLSFDLARELSSKSTSKETRKI